MYSHNLRSVFTGPNTLGIYSVIFTRETNFVPVSFVYAKRLLNPFMPKGLFHLVSWTDPLTVQGVSGICSILFLNLLHK